MEQKNITTDSGIEIKEIYDAANSTKGDNSLPG